MDYFEVPVQYFPLVELFHGEEYFCEEYFGVVLGEFEVGEVVEELAAGVEFQEEVQVAF
jgi:hypothetical protein